MNDVIDDQYAGIRRALNAAGIGHFTQNDTGIGPHLILDVEGWALVRLFHPEFDASGDDEWVLEYGTDDRDPELDTMPADTSPAGIVAGIRRVLFPSAATPAEREDTTATMQQPTADLSDVVVNGRRIADYVRVGQTLADYARAKASTTAQHTTHRTTDAVGYVVRETVRGGDVLWHGEVRNGRHARCGYDVAVIAGGNRYAEAVTIADAYRASKGGYAVIDSLYPCGCRSDY